MVSVFKHYTHDNELSKMKSLASFFSRDEFFNDEKPYYFTGELTATEAHLRTNQAFEEHEITFQNLRDIHNQYTLEDHGVEFIHHRSNTDLGVISDNIIAAYLSEITSFVKQKLDAEYCFCYSYKV